MHPIFEDFKKNVNRRNTKQFKVLGISKRLMDVLEMDEDDLQFLNHEDGRLSIGEYEIMPVQRDFKPWVLVLEITEKGMEGTPGLDHQPSWMKDEDATGITTTNIPPDDVVDYVIDILNILKQPDKK